MCVLYTSSCTLPAFTSCSSFLVYLLFLFFFFLLLFLYFKDELSKANHSGSKSSSPSHQGSVSKSGARASLQSGGSQSNTLASSQGGTSKSNTPTSTYSGNSQSTTPLSPSHGEASTGVSPVSSLGGGSTASDVTMESVDTSLQKQDASDRLNKNLDWNNGKPESSKNITAVQEGQQGQLGCDAQESASTPLTEGKSHCT